MNAKQLAMESLQDLPDTATWEEVEERIRFVAAVERGRDQMVADDVLPDAEVRESLEEWLTP
jgi:hypothetical protein